MQWGTVLQASLMLDSMARSSPSYIDTFLHFIQMGAFKLECLSSSHTIPTCPMPVFQGSLEHLDGHFMVLHSCRLQLQWDVSAILGTVFQACLI